MNVKNILVVLSVTANILFTALLVLAASRKGAFVSFLSMDEGELSYTTGACLVSTPRGSGGAVFAPLELSLGTGEKAAVQFSALFQGVQMNITLEPLYDHEIIAVEQSGYGMVIRARAPGQTLLQAVTGEGIRDIVRVTVAAPR